MAGACTQGVGTGFVALGYTKVALLGVFQGITEFLPTSSMAHMRIVPSLLGWQHPGSAFLAAMQLAALAVVISCFWRDVSQLATGSIRAFARRDFKDRSFQFSLWIILATVPIGLAGPSLASVLDKCGSPLRSLAVIGWACIVMAELLAVAEIFARHKRTLEDAACVDAMVVGIAQVGALIPGVSRSGLYLDCGIGNRAEARRGCALLLPPGSACNRLGGTQRSMGATQDSPVPRRLVDSACRLVVVSVSAFAAIWGIDARARSLSAWPLVIYRGALGGHSYHCRDIWPYFMIGERA